MEPYKPTNRDLYEELELLSVSRKQCPITYKGDNGGISTINAVVDKLYTRDNGVKYLVLDNGLEIPLDHIITLNGWRPNNFC